MVEPAGNLGVQYISGGLSVQVVSGYWTGIGFKGDMRNDFWRITCPCGVTVTYPLNGLPEVDTKHPCDNPDHWTVKYE